MNCFTTTVMTCSFVPHSIYMYGLSWWLSGKESAFSVGDAGSILIPWRRKWQPTLVFSPGESHGQRSLVGHSPWGHKESDMT